MISIKNMTVEDIDFVCLWENYFFKSSLGKEMLKSEILENPFARDYVFFDNDEKIGYLSSRIMPPQAEILNLFIIKDYQGRGIGSMMLKSVIEDFIAQGAHQISLEVREGNIPAIRLYSSLGFKKAYVRKNYYQDGENAILMLKEV